MLLQAAEKTIDYIIDTVSAVHSLDEYIALLKINGKMILVGVPESPLQLSPTSVIIGKCNLHPDLLYVTASGQQMCSYHLLECSSSPINHMSHVSEYSKDVILQEVT
jgi:D-arabinose 1-dehydrogenase-like Zn-dependent alcohol dehydrogenase